MAIERVIVGQYTFDARDGIIRVQFRVAQRGAVTVAFNDVRARSAMHNLAVLLADDGSRQRRPIRLTAPKDGFVLKVH